jgi:flavin-dependent dehydrogenase
VKVDVPVVGAGPAGAATAIHLARGVARVLLADKADPVVVVYVVNRNDGSGEFWTQYENAIDGACAA